MTPKPNSSPFYQIHLIDLFSLCPAAWNIAFGLSLVNGNGNVIEKELACALDDQIKALNFKLRCCMKIKIIWDTKPK